MKTTLLCLLVLICVAQAQEVIAPPPENTVTPPALQQVQTDRVGVIQPAGAAPGAPQRTQPLQWGPVSIEPSLLYRFLYGTGIQSSPGQSQSTAIHEVAPELALGLGSHWVLDYTPTWTFYSNHQFRDTLDHAVRLAGGTTHGDWVLGLSQGYARTDQPLIETGQQTSLETYSTAVNASYHFSRAMLLELGASQNLTFADKFTNTREWSTSDWLTYQFWPRFDAGIGAGVGYDDVSVGNNSVFEQFQGRINWRAADKISFQIHGGVEERQFQGSGSGGDLINPIFGGSLQYQPFETTTLSLSADHGVSTSLFTNQVAESTDFSGNLNQRLLKRLNLSLGGGYHIVRYVASANGVSAGRNDDYYSFNVRLSSAFLKRGTVAAFYQFSDNSSNRAGFGYSSSQVGIEVGYRY
jgi:hypothetical protein